MEESCDLALAKGQSVLCIIIVSVNFVSAIRNEIAPSIVYIRTSSDDLDLGCLYDDSDH